MAGAESDRAAASGTVVPSLSPRDDAESSQLRLPEIIVGFVGPVGSGFRKQLVGITEDALRGIGYTAFPTIHVSDYFAELLPNLHLPNRDAVSVDERYISYMHAGDELRHVMRHKGAAALAAITGIAAFRQELTQDREVDTPSDNTVFLIDSLKTPEEAEVLRTIYGHRFILIAAYCPRNQRVDNLTLEIREGPKSEDVKFPRAKAEEIVQRDEHGQEHDLFGQNVRDVYPVADLMVRTGMAGSDPKAEIERFFNLLFGRVLTFTPTPSEQAMYFAFSSSLRSASLSRQVGAAITSKRGDLLSIGCNEAPRAGGGAYWETDRFDGRTFQLKEDPSTRQREQLLADIIRRLQSAGWRPPVGQDEQAVDSLIQHFRAWQDAEAQTGQRAGTLIEQTIEFFREVHAEMLAISSAAFRGIALEKAMLYTTTFPCHDCAKHIVASGIEGVVFLEPYPKSLVRELHLDSIAIEGEPTARRGGHRVLFSTFTGIGPRRYATLFRVLQRRRLGRNAEPPDIRMAEHDVPSLPSLGLEYVESEAAIQREKIVFLYLSNQLEALTTRDKEA